MPASKAMSYTDRVLHIIDTYNLPIRHDARESMRRRVRDSDFSGRERLAEEEAAIFLARALRDAVTAELRSGIESRAMGSILDAWSRFTQQAMFRADVGLINSVLYTCEILPHIDDVERLLRDGIAEDEDSNAHLKPHEPRMPL